MLTQIKRLFEAEKPTPAMGQAQMKNIRTGQAAVRRRWTSLNSIVSGTTTRKLNAAEHPEMIRHEVESTAVVKNHRTIFGLKALCQKNIVDALNFGPTWIDVRILRWRIGIPTTARMTFAKGVAESELVVQNEANGGRVRDIIEISAEHFWTISRLRVVPPDRRQSCLRLLPSPFDHLRPIGQVRIGDQQTSSSHHKFRQQNFALADHPAFAAMARSPNGRPAVN